MGLAGAYLNVKREGHGMRPSVQAVADFDDIVVDLGPDRRREQASRCMNCGVPFCQSGLRFCGARQATGCPLHNLIPETNDLLFQGRWDDAAARLAMTNPFPEFTGRVCPAPCEVACNLGLNDEAVTIHDNERALSDYAWSAGLEPFKAPADDAPLVSVVGSGPAGLSAAWEFARRGLRVRVYERDERPGGLLMFGIPNMKLPKQIVTRRIELMERSGIEFACGVDAAARAEEISVGSAAVVLACGARQPRTLDVPGADLDGIHFAVPYLSEATRALLEDRDPNVTARGKDVAVIGGGDTGVDCVATALRQGARSVRQIIRASEPPEEATAAWPGPRVTSAMGYGQKEAADLFGADPRIWGTDTVGFSGDDAGAVCAVQVDGAGTSEGAAVPSEVPAQLVLIAKGFTGAEQSVLDAFAGFGNVRVAGDARMGSTLVATAMADALQIASDIADSLMAKGDGR